MTSLSSDAPGSPEGLLDLTALESAAGSFCLHDCAWEPRPGGILRTHRLRLPAFARACYFAPFQKYAINPALDLWPEGYNQCHPLPVADFRGVKRGGMFALIELRDGRFLALLPLASSRLMSWMRGDGSGLVLETGHWGTGGYRGDAPLLAWGCDANPYRACERAWRSAAEQPEVRGNFRLREDKPYPEYLEYLGWCTWEEFKLEIDEALLVRTIDELEAVSVPIRWLLVDDGHLDSPWNPNANTQEGAAALTSDRLVGLGVNATKFPNGWKPVFDRAKGTRLRWLGVWLNFNGYWGGIASENTLGESLNSRLMEVAPGQLVPKDDAEASAVFYEELVRLQKEAGFRFLKVDNQAHNVTFYQGKVANAVAAAAGNHRGLEQAVERHLDGMTNCMAHNTICAMNTAFSQVTRCSEDYKKGDIWRAKHHLNNSYHNMLWLGQSVWGDHDMFHSSDALAAALFARSKAISGGPVYLSDVPAKIDVSLVKSLCFEDGRILRPLTPAAPTRDSLFVNPYEDATAYRVMAALPNRSVALIAYNITHPEKAVRGAVLADDYRFAPGMMQEGEAEWPFPPEGVVCFEPSSGTATRMVSGEMLPVALPGFGDVFHLLVPVARGWAVIGRADKILAPCGVEAVEAVDDCTLRLRMPEQGPLLIWKEEGRPRVEGFGAMLPAGEGIWRADLPVVPGPVTLTVRT